MPCLRPLFLVISSLSSRPCHNCLFSPFVALSPFVPFVVPPPSHPLSCHPPLRPLSRRLLCALHCAIPLCTLCRAVSLRTLHRAISLHALCHAISFTPFVALSPFAPFVVPSPLCPLSCRLLRTLRRTLFAPRCLSLCPAHTALRSPPFIQVPSLSKHQLMPTTTNSTMATILTKTNNHIYLKYLVYLANVTR